MTQEYHEINEQLAKTAKEMNSIYSYEKASATEEYRNQVDFAIKVAEAQKKIVDARYHDKIDNLLDVFALKLAENTNKGFEIETRCPSMLISGPANFPVRKKEKQNSARIKNMNEYRDIKKILDRIQSVGTGGISSDDPNALKQLTERLESMMARQEMMKATNAYYRKHKTLDGCPALNPVQIERLTAEMETRFKRTNAYRPYETYALTNNNAEIKRIKERVEQLKKIAESDISGWVFDCGRVDANKEENRLQVFFDERPSKETCYSLKKHGFKWAPSQKAWQRLLNGKSLYAIRSFCKEHELNLKLK